MVLFDLSGVSPDGSVECAVLVAVAVKASYELTAWRRQTANVMRPGSALTGDRQLPKVRSRSCGVSLHPLGKHAHGERASR